MVPTFLPVLAFVRFPLDTERHQRQWLCGMARLWGQHSPAADAMEANAERACGVEGIDGVDGDLPHEEGFKLGRRRRALCRHHGSGRDRADDGGDRREE